MAEAPEEVVDELYGAPLGEFITKRDARAKELRKSDRAASDAVKKLRKPSVSAAAVNQLARSSAGDVEALLAAGEALRQAQLGGGDRDAVRSAARDEREAVEKLAAAAGKLSPGTLEEVRETLHAAASDDDVRELVRRGVLTEARRPMGFAGLAPSAAPGGRSAKPRPKPEADADAKADAEAEAKAEAKRHAEAEREAEAERRRAAKARVKAARAALRDAEKALERADREASAARDEVARRQHELEAAEEA
jgi:hypothetical protein